MSRISSIARGARKFVVDNTPAILTGMAVAGVVTTTVLAVRATPRAHMDIQHAESERTEPLTTIEKIRLVGVQYIPAAASGVLTIVCIVGASSVHSKRHAAIMSAYSLSETAFKEYQQKVHETFGESKERKVRDDVAQDKVAREFENSEIIMTGNGDQLFMDTISGRFFDSTVEKVRRAELDIDRQAMNDGYVSLNEFYSLLGLASVDIGEELGWTSDKSMNIQISATTTMTPHGVTKAVLVINYGTSPIRNYYKFGG